MTAEEFRLEPIAYAAGLASAITGQAFLDALGTWADEWLDTIGHVYIGPAFTAGWADGREITAAASEATS